MSAATTKAGIAYYSMEIALRDAVPTFSGGLGVLAGDHLRAAADHGLPVAAVSLLYSHGFFRQSLASGEQCESPVEWSPADQLEELPVRVSVVIGGRPVAIKVWRDLVTGAGGHVVPVHFLDTALDENIPEDRGITDRLYTSDPYDRLRQEAVLGLGGPLALEALGFDDLAVHHLNEGHGALVPIGLLARTIAAANPTGVFGEGIAAAGSRAIESVRRRCVFTTHTPVPAGHDRFTPDVARAALGSALVDSLASLGCLETDGTLNMTVLGMRCAGFVNAVSLRHGEISRRMFPAQPIETITNGVHTATWAAPATAELFDRHLPGWRSDSVQLHYAGAIPLDELRAAHAANKRALCAEVGRRSGVVLKPDVLTIGIARRFAAYKRNDLVVSDPDRLAAIAQSGPVQIVFSGKAHPGDGDGKAMIRRVAAAAAASSARPGRRITVVFIEDYGMDLGRLLCSGSDVWLNNPASPNEASGTSGMKAALNGVPSLSTLDGWWLEGHIEGVTGWAIGAVAGQGATPDADGDRLYEILERLVIPTFYKDPDGILAMGRHAIALNGSFFSAHRMVDEYARRAYRLVG